MTKLNHILLCTLLLAGSARAADPERKLVRREEPEYPALADKMALHGTVKLKIWIAPDGSVRRLEYVGGHPVLAESAIAGNLAITTILRNRHFSAPACRKCAKGRFRLNLVKGAKALEID